jgi:guanylate kinase
MNNNNKPGILFILSGPSGVGKGTVCKKLLAEDQNLRYSVSVTTRSPREGEIDGVSYYFITKEDFLLKREQGEFLEWAEVYGNFYGSPLSAARENLAAGHDVILEIDIQGAKKVKKHFPDGVYVFLMPPSAQELDHRIRKRGTDGPESIRLRLSSLKKEVEAITEYDYVVVNDVLERAVQKIRYIISAEQCRQKRFRADEYITWQEVTS